MAHSADRGEPSQLRGLLSQVFMPALLSGEGASLAVRLGERSTLVSPLWGRAHGAAELSRMLELGASWLRAQGAKFEPEGVVVGSDRDVSEGRLLLAQGGNTQTLPVAVVTEKRRDREVEVRLYHMTRGLGAPADGAAATLADDERLIVPPPVASHLDALARADLDGLIAGFEYGATLRAADGKSYGGAGGTASLTEYYGSLGAQGATPGAGTRIIKSARADDGTTCALECTLVRFRGQDVPRRPVLAVYERGESGLLKALRLYGDLG